MRNILAIAGKELRGYFASPIALHPDRLLRAALRLVLLRAARVLRAAEHADGDGHGRAASHERQPDADRPAADERHGDHAVRVPADHDAHLLGREALGHDRAAAHLAAHRPADHPRASSSARWRSTRRCWRSRWSTSACSSSTATPEWKPIADRLPRPAADGRLLPLARPASSRA